MIKFWRNRKKVTSEQEERVWAVSYTHLTLPTIA